MGDVTILGGQTTLDIPADRVLDGAKEENLKELIIIGWDKDDQLYIASNTGKMGNLNLLLDLAKLDLLRKHDM